MLKRQHFRKVGGGDGTGLAKIWGQRLLRREDSKYRSWGECRVGVLRTSKEAGLE